MSDKRTAPDAKPVLPGGRRQWLLHCSLLACALPWQAHALAAEAAQKPTLLVLGDSLSAEYGLARGSGWVALLGERLAKRPRPWQVVNGSISGDTTAGGRSRLPALLKQHRPKVVIIELGGNDALRGLPLASTRDNLDQMVRQAQAQGAKVLV